MGTNRLVSFFKQAQAAFMAEDYPRAVDLFERAILDRPELGGIYRFNLELARARLRDEAVATALSLPRTSAIYLDDLYRELARFVGQMPREPPGQGRPLVSVVMTAHNLERYIEQAVTSVLSQTYAPLELIVVDDCSTDGTWRILQRLADEFPVVIRRLNTKLGTYFAKNAGLSLAQGEFVFFQDGDDLSHPERIRLSLHKMRQLVLVG
jgi:hypothetical protein